MFYGFSSVKCGTCGILPVSLREQNEVGWFLCRMTSRQKSTNRDSSNVLFDRPFSVSVYALWISGCQNSTRIKCLIMYNLFNNVLLWLRISAASRKCNSTTESTFDVNVSRVLQLELEPGDIVNTVHCLR